MYVLVCSIQANPCPAESQAVVSLSDAVDLAALGLTSAGVVQAFTWGLAAVLGLWCAGYSIGVVRRVVGKA